jgi:hemerythrin-like domain-containing protein
MSKVIETLMNEHRLIEKVLGSLQTFVGQLAPAQPEARTRVAAYAEFFREFADRCHHGKEEDRLFVTMGNHGFSSTGGPVYVMLQEHELGRSHVRALAGVGEGDGELSASEVVTVRTHALEFISLLAAHIMKEDKILFPAADRTIPSAELDSLAAAFDEFETSVMGDGTQERLRALADSLIVAFPPDMSVSGGGD